MLTADNYVEHHQDRELFFPQKNYKETYPMLFILTLWTIMPPSYLLFHLITRKKGDKIFPFWILKDSLIEGALIGFMLALMMTIIAPREEKLVSETHIANISTTRVEKGSLFLFFADTTTIPYYEYYVEKDESYTLERLNTMHNAITITETSNTPSSLQVYQRFVKKDFQDFVLFPSLGTETRYHFSLPTGTVTKDYKLS